MKGSGAERKGGKDTDGGAHEVRAERGQRAVRKEAEKGRKTQDPAPVSGSAEKE